MEANINWEIIFTNKTIFYSLLFAFFELWYIKQETYRRYTGDTQGTYRRHTGGIQETGDIHTWYDTQRGHPGAYRRHKGDKQGTYKRYTWDTQGTHRRQRRHIEDILDTLLLHVTDLLPVWAMSSKSAWQSSHNIVLTTKISWIIRVNILMTQFL